MAFFTGRWIHVLNSFIWTLVVLLHLISLTRCFTEEFTDEFVVQVKAGDWQEVRDELERLQTSFIKLILPEFYLFRDDMYSSLKERLPKLLQENTLLKTKIKHFERVREFTMDSYDGRINAASASSHDQTQLPQLQKCPTFSDMGVEAVWKMGYTGKGVVIAITDAGINTDIPDLKPNIRLDHSYNYVANTPDVTPERCYNSDIQSTTLTDHGNNCAGVVGAARNDICGDGIAFETQIIGVKMIEVAQKYGRCSINVETSWIAQGLKHEIEKVDVYSNSWGSTIDFLTGSEVVKNALQTGTEEGRNGKGSIYVFPAGSLSDPCANDIHAITVNSLDNSGHAAPFSRDCACTLTSAYGEQCTNSTHAMYTTSYDRAQCTLDFEGTSASTAIVAGIIGLALHANQNLSWRDVQHLIVQSSDPDSIADNIYFGTNGAGKRYHPVLGFGLLNATVFISLAKTMTPLSNQLVKTTLSRKIRRRDRHSRYEECLIDIECHTTCINRTENVLVSVTYETPDEYHSELTLVSPSGTESQLMKRGQSLFKSRTSRVDAIFKSVNFWGEAAEGNWTMTLHHLTNNDSFRISSCELTVYGTGYESTEPTPSITGQTNPPDIHGQSDNDQHKEGGDARSNSSKVETTRSPTRNTTRSRTSQTNAIVIGICVLAGIVICVTIIIVRYRQEIKACCSKYCCGHSFHSTVPVSYDPLKEIN